MLGPAWCVKQGTTLDRRLGRGGFQLPAASLSSFIVVSMLLSVPLDDRFFVPLTRGRTGNPRGISLLQRLGVGFESHILVALVAYTVELPRIQVVFPTASLPRWRKNFRQRTLRRVIA